MCPCNPRDHAGEATEEGASLWSAMLPHCNERLLVRVPHPTSPLRPGSTALVCLPPPRTPRPFHSPLAGSDACRPAATRGSLPPAP